MPRGIDEFPSDIREAAQMSIWKKPLRFTLHQSQIAKSSEGLCEGFVVQSEFSEELRLLRWPLKVQPNQNF